MKLFNWFKKKEEPEHIIEPEPVSNSEPQVIGGEDKIIEQPQRMTDRDIERIYGFSKFGGMPLAEHCTLLCGGHDSADDFYHYTEEQHINIRRNMYSNEVDALEHEIKDLEVSIAMLNDPNHYMQITVSEHEKEFDEAYEYYSELQQKLEVAQDVEEQRLIAFDKQTELMGKTPFTKDDVKAKEGEFDKLQDLLKDDKLHADMAAADFYCGGHSQEDAEYGASYDEMRCANYCVDHRENEISETQEQINDMSQTLDDNHNKLNADWNKSNEMDQGFEPER